MVLPQLDVDIIDYLSKKSMYAFSWKVDTLLCKCEEFLLTDYCHDIIADEVVNRYRTEYDKQLSEYNEQDNDQFSS